MYCYFNHLNFLHLTTGSFSMHSVQFLLHTRFAGVCWDWKQTGTGPRIYSLSMKTLIQELFSVWSSASVYTERDMLGRTVAMSFTRFKVSVVICWTLLSSRPSFDVVCLPGHHLLSAVLTAIICCRLYSHTSIAPLTWTFSDRITPCCGISTHTSSRLIRSAGIPSFSFLYKTHSNSDKSGRKRGKHLPHINNCCIYEIRLSNYPSKSSVLVGNLKSFSDTLLAVCSTPTRV